MTEKTDRGEIGEWAYANKSEPGNGGKLTEKCYNYALSVMNTHFIHSKQNRQNLATWHDAENGKYKRPGYIMISNKQRNG